VTPDVSPVGLVVTDARSHRRPGRSYSTPPSERGRVPSERQQLLAATVTALTHTLVVGLLWRGFDFESLLAAASTDALYVGYLVVGMLAVGVVPGAGYARRELVSPLLVVGALLVGAGTATWLSLRGGATPVGPTPLGWYALLWPVTLGLAVVAAVGEERLA
jgi:hypothetical protein